MSWYRCDCCAVATPGILFDWAIPLLAPTSAACSADVGVQFAALSALRECLAVADDLTLARYATVTLSACQKLLEEERTPMQLLPPLLGALTQVASHFFHSLPSAPPPLPTIIVSRTIAAILSSMRLLTPRLGHRPLHHCPHAELVCFWSLHQYSFYPVLNGD